MRGREVVLGLCTLAALAGATGVAHARCGAVRHALPPGAVDRAHRPPLAIGDSSMTLALPTLARAGFEVDQRPCRRVNEGLALLRLRRARRSLPKAVLFHLGVNSGITTAQIRSAMRILGRSRILALVTPRGGRHARIVRAAGRRWPRNIRVFDWVRAHHGDRSYFADGGQHPSAKGVRLYLRLVRPVLRLNRPGPIYIERLTRTPPRPWRPPARRV